MQNRSPSTVVHDWHDALNAEDAEGVLRLSDPNIEIVGPRGSGFGHALLRAWLAHARVRLEPRRVFARGSTVVVEQHGVWRAPESGEVLGEADVASFFRVVDGRVAYYARFDSTGAALAAAGLSEADEV